MKYNMDDHNTAMKMVKDTIFNDPEFIKSGDSGVFNPICVEVARKNGLVAVRDSKNKSITPMVFSNTEWEAFINEAKRGGFDV